MSRVTSHVPMVAGLAYREALGKLPRQFTAVLKPDPQQPYHRRAIAVHAGTQKIGYVSPEIGRHFYDEVARAGEIACPARHAPGASPANGIEVLLDLTAILSGRGV